MGTTTYSYFCTCGAMVRRVVTRTKEEYRIPRTNQLKVRYTTRTEIRPPGSVYTETAGGNIAVVCPTCIKDRHPQLARSGGPGDATKALSPSQATTKPLLE